jgi:3-oxoadipate enol-lactonase
MQARSLRIARPDGRIQHVRRLGDGRCACVLIHGFGEGSYVWDEFLPSIASDYDAIAIDLRGHGDSEWDPEARYETQRHVADVIHLVRTLDLDPLVLIGHSMGGEIAIRVAAECVERMVGLVIVDFGPGLNREGLRQVRAEFDASNQAYRCVEDYADWLAERRPLIAYDVLLRLTKSALRIHADMGFRLKADPAITTSRQEELDGDDCESTLWPLFPQMSWPVLVVRGAGSALLSRDAAERMIASCPDARLHSVPVAGHGVMLDNPEGFAAAVRPFLSQLPARQPTYD